MKNARTKRLRQAIAEAAPAALEDWRAGGAQTTLSFSSETHPHRHVWIDTDLGGLLVIDLEEWADETERSKPLAQLAASDEDVPKIVQAWLTGATCQECLRVGGRRQFFSLEEAVDYVIAELSPAAKAHLRTLGTEEELLTEAIRGHHGLGRWIRNACGLWVNKHLLRSIADSHMQEISRRLAEDDTPTVKGRSFLESELGYLEKCRRDDSFHPDDFSRFILCAVWKRLKGTDDSHRR